MPAPLLAIAGHSLRRLLLRRLAKVALVALPVVVVGGGAVALLAVLVLGGSEGDQDGGYAGSQCSTVTAATAVTVADLTPEQVSNAQTIVAVGRQLKVPAYGWVIAVATAMQESTLRNIDYGHLDSLGLFQQRDAWGSRDERLDPAVAARLFYAGGRGGQPGLLDVKDFQSMPLTAAAQEVQASAFPGAYARWEPLAREVVADPTVLSATCYDSVAYTGDGTPGARAVAGALRWLGTPYSWGGGGPSGPSLGFGPGAMTVGFDCSSLAQFAWKQAGVNLPRVTDAQAASLPRVPPSSPLQAGDLLFFATPGAEGGSYGHMGIYDGQGNMVHAPRTGKTVEVVHDVMSVPYFRDRLAVIARPTPPQSDEAVAASG
ncbi:C40 family peptidase [Knoellia sp. 3-2P3]|uniref:C40 family peptidase n=1 Tax=unclassified Knoellia TaxID=2618719 RepID=UPI0023DB103F|nr:C40 family peptidase [Knoellia sp. 3-2P3]MDF2090840.1 C40 family peptidase [Knoellia sp. 3-2P3]